MDNVIKLVRVVEDRKYLMPDGHVYNSKIEADAFIDGYKCAIKRNAERGEDDIKFLELCLNSNC